MNGKQLDPGSWKAELRKCSQEWHKLSPNEQDPYNAKAAEEQALKESAAREPFASKEKAPASSMPEADNNAANLLSRNARKTIARNRVMATHSQFKNAVEWTELDGGLCNADGCLGLDFIDLGSTDDTIVKKWSEFARAAPDLPKEWLDNNQNERAVHHSVCHNECGLCKLNPLRALAAKYVYNMADLISAGISFFWTWSGTLGSVLLIT